MPAEKDVRKEARTEGLEQGYGDRAPLPITNLKHYVVQCEIAGQQYSWTQSVHMQEWVLGQFQTKPITSFVQD